MTKKWEDLTQAEKIEDLRRDMLATMATVNSWIAQQKQLGAFHNDLMRKVSEVSEAVRVLEARTR
jgi:hypothetical protein